MHYYLYKITNKSNGKQYVGVHQTKYLNDGYMGSGKVIRQAIEKYGKDNFTKEILEFYDNAQDMLQSEKAIVTREFVDRKDVYNLKEGGAGGFEFINKHRLNLTPEFLAKRGKSISETFKTKPRIPHKTPHTNETKVRLSEIKKEYYRKGGKHAKGMLGKKHNEETKTRVSKTLKEIGYMVGKKGLEHPVGGTKWYNNGSKHKRSSEHPGEGWEEGRMFQTRNRKTS